LSIAKPNLIINCVGLIKQISESQNPIQAISINSLLPHRLTALSKLIDARLIHISTDCVFSGNLGGYKESDVPDAEDLYGRSKLLGEINSENTITIRTSIIGHEPNSQSRSLVDWFISQRNPVSGYVNAIFSGLPCVELAMIIRDFVLPSNELHGLFHISSEPINKFELLKLIAQVYDLDTHIYPDRSLCINRSLDSSKFSNATGYRPKKWVDLINQMHTFQVGSPF
jgi:dTDP-4-dehydrorhamnose reductase